MAGLKMNYGQILLASGMRAVELDEKGNLHVILPEGAELFVIASDSGLHLQGELTARSGPAGGGAANPSMLCIKTIKAVRVAPRPELHGSENSKQFTCPECGSHKFGSVDRGGRLIRHCHGDSGCKFTFGQEHDHLYFKEES